MCSVTQLTKAATLHERSQLRAAQVPLFRAILAPLLEREINAARRIITQGTNLNAWVEEFYPSQQEAVAKAIGPVSQTYGEQTAELLIEEMGSGTVPPSIKDFAAEYAAGLAARWTNDAIAQIRQIQRDEEEVNDPLLERLDTWEQSRADRQAEREATQGAGAFATHTMIASGISRMTWKTVGDSCPLCRRMGGRTVGVSDPFLVAGASLEARDAEGVALRLITRRSIGHPPLHGAGKRGGVCDCLVSPWA